MRRRDVTEELVNHQTFLLKHLRRLRLTAIALGEGRQFPGPERLIDIPRLKHGHDILEERARGFAHLQACDGLEHFRRGATGHLHLSRGGCEPHQAEGE